MKKLTLLLLPFFLAGCASVGNEMDMSQMDNIEKGETTKAQLLEWFGSPMTVGIDSEGQTMATWIYSAAKSNLIGKMETRLQQLVVIYDENDVVKQFTFNENNSTAKPVL